MVKLDFTISFLNRAIYINSSRAPPDINAGNFRMEIFLPINDQRGAAVCSFCINMLIINKIVNVDFNILFEI
jgi:hypothetical protein